MAGADLVRPSRDGDQFHYLWAARQCLQLLPGVCDLVAVTVEGASTIESTGEAIEAGEALIDVGLYFGEESLERARLIRYVQLKHSTRQVHEPWLPSGLEHTIRGFAKRFSELLKRFPAEGVARRFQFAFTTNRPIDPETLESVADLASRQPPRHPKVAAKLVKFAGLAAGEEAVFFGTLTLEGGEDDLWTQRNLLSQDLSAYLPDADCDAPVQLKELIARKATSEFESNPSVRRHDVLRALKTSDELLFPAPSLIPDPATSLAREQEPELRDAIIAARAPLLLHADGGVGKSVLAARLAQLMPPGSQSVLYDCFGDGLYRNALNFRHRPRDALVQMANELAARGLCHPLIPSPHADAKQYILAFLYRLKQAVAVIQANRPNALLCLVVDAADNAEMAAEEQNEPASFVRGLVAAPLPDGVRLVLTSRSHRRSRLGTLPDAVEIELRPFSHEESARHLRGVYPAADDRDVAEFAYLSSQNPRVQALAMDKRLPLAEMLTRLGPTPTTVEAAIGELLTGAVKDLRDREGPIAAAQIDEICRGLAVLRPLVPISVLSRLSQVPEGAIRSFAFDLGRPLLVKGDSLHFLDEPAETWFRDRFKPDGAGLSAFLERLRPLAAHSSYVAAVLPHLLLEAGRMEELVEIAMSGDALPTDNPIERRDVELQRLTFALKACLQGKRYCDAAKLAMKAGGEAAGEQRQVNLIQANTDLAAALISPDRLEELVSRRTFGADWMGSHHAYDAGLLSGREELAAEGASRLRMAMDWLYAWARQPRDAQNREEVTDADRAELTVALLRLRGPEEAAGFLRRWRHRRIAFDSGLVVASRLMDLGRYDQLDALALAAGNDIWLLLALAHGAREGGRSLPIAALERMLRLLGDRRVQLPESTDWNKNWAILQAVTATVEQALRVLTPDSEAWASLIRRYLPTAPPADLTSRYGFDRAPILKAYALEAALRDVALTLVDVAPPDIRAELEGPNGSHARKQETQIFKRQVGGLLAWSTLGADILCRRAPADIGAAVRGAMEATANANRSSYEEGHDLANAMSKQWLRMLADLSTDVDSVGAFKSWKGSLQVGLWPGTLTELSWLAARTPNLGSMALDFASEAFNLLEDTREDAETRADSYVRLARSVVTISPLEAEAYFNRAVEVASRIGDENLDRWAAMLNLGEAAATPAHRHPEMAYRLSRVAELTYEYVARDKHFDWDRTVEVLTDLCPSSALTILSRWRDRRFGDADRLLPIVIYRMRSKGLLPEQVAVAFAALDAQWDRLADLKRFLASEQNPVRRERGAGIAYRYTRVQQHDLAIWAEIQALGATYDVQFPDIDRLVASSSQRSDKKEVTLPALSNEKPARRAPDWDAIFDGVDLTSPLALQTAYAALRTYDPPYEFEVFYTQAFARVAPGREPDLVRAITAWPAFSMYDARYLVDAVPEALFQRAGFRKALRDLTTTVCHREPQRVFRRGWGQLLPFDQLVTAGVLAEADIVKATLDGFTDQIDSLDAREVFHIVECLAASLKPDEALDALVSSLDLLEEVLTPKDGDGPWRAELEPPADALSALGGYVWAGLGSPVAAARWEMAHAVRAIVELNWTDLLAAILERASENGAGAFVDRGLEFYLWHARQWLLIGLMRGGLENPSALAPAAPMLRSALLGDHVVIRAMAAQCLKSFALCNGDGTDTLTALDAVNCSPFPPKIYTGWSYGDAEDEPEGALETISDDQKYYFGIDIGPYWFQPLGRVFGLTESAVDRRALVALRQDLGWINGGWRDDARHKRRLFRDSETSHSHGSLPPTDDLRAYHGYHAMMLVAGALLRERPVGKSDEKDADDFQDWLNDYLLTRTDGRWLADRRDPKLVSDAPPAEGYADAAWRWRVDAAYMDRQLSADGNWTVLWGHWSTGDQDHRESVWVRSALVSGDSAEALLTALQTSAEPRRFELPEAQSNEAVAGVMGHLSGWIIDESVPDRLDGSDPWANGLRFPGPQPSPDVVKSLGLSPDDERRSWRVGNRVSLRCETWSVMDGYGRERAPLRGWRLSGDAGLVQELLLANPGDLLILSVEVRRDAPRYGEGKGEFEPYPWPYMRFYLLGANGVAVSL